MPLSISLPLDHIISNCLPGIFTLSGPPLPRQSAFSDQGVLFGFRLFSLPLGACEGIRTSAAVAKFLDHDTVI